MDLQPAHRPNAKEIFMSEIQQQSRARAILHHTYIIEPVSDLLLVPADTVIDAITDKLAIAMGMTVHKSTDSNIVVSFPYHKEAARSLKLSTDEKLFCVGDSNYRFRMTPSFSPFEPITINRRASITLTDLPLQMWTPQIVEQILSPYCALDFIDATTRGMEDLSGFKCTVRYQKRLPIPDQITVKIADTDSTQTSSAASTATSVFLNMYTVKLQKYHFIYGMTENCRYTAFPNQATADRIVSPAECYIYPEMIDTNLIRKYSSAVILRSKPGSYYSDIQNVCEFTEESIHIRVTVKLLGNNTFLIYTAQQNSDPTLLSLLTLHLDEAITSGDIELIKWSPEYGSVGIVDTQKTHLKIKNLPCNLCTPKIIQYILSPFAMVEAHLTESHRTPSGFWHFYCNIQMHRMDFQARAHS